MIIVVVSLVRTDKYSMVLKLQFDQEKKNSQRQN